MSEFDIFFVVTLDTLNFWNDGLRGRQTDAPKTLLLPNARLIWLAAEVVVWGALVITSVANICYF